MTNVQDSLKNLFIRIHPPNVPKPSFVWNYFGYLYKKPNEPLDTERVYCKICFDKLKDEEPDISFSSIKRNIGVYSATSGTGNLKNHLLACHQTTETQQTKTTNQHILSMFSRDRYATKASQLKQQLGHQLTLMCCRDLLPFSIVENEGFQDFLIANRVVASKDDIPSRTILSPINLNKIYDVCLQKTKEQLKLASSYPTVTCDTWCDKYKHRSYICFTIHFLDSNSKLHKYSLKTEPFDGPHTGEAVKDIFLTVMNEFNLNPNNIIVVSDKGSNMRKAWKFMNVIHTFCIAHGIHNWLMKDCLPQLANVPTILDKIQLIINKLRYRQHELEEEFRRLNDRMNNNLLQAINEAGEILDADLTSSSTDIDDIIGLNDDTDDDSTETWSMVNLALTSTNKQQRSTSNLLTFTNTNESDRFHTLKKRIVTRWNTILIMLRSYAPNIPGIEILLRRLKHYELILTPDENQIVNDLIGFLSVLESTVTILSASKSYPTMSLYLLLRMEIESLLRINQMESSVIHELKVLLSASLDKRFPVIPLNICAFLLDPSQLKLDISRYLVQNQTKESILFDMLKQFKIHRDPQVSSIRNISTTSTSSPSTSSSIASPSASPSIASPPTTPILMKRYLSVEFSYSQGSNTKKLRESLIQKHTPPQVSNADPVLNEIEKYLKLDISCEDVLQFWGSSGNTFPHLKRLALIVLAISATSTPSEQVFSTTGLIVNAKRTMLSPENVGKIQVIHDNYDLFKKI